jgi:hypothetical protein
MDYRTGKLSQEDYKAIDRQLRAEAVELLRRLDALGASGDERVGRDRRDDSSAHSGPTL